MKRKQISETIENINPKYIDEATRYSGKVKISKGKVWYKWALAAACFAFVLAVSIPFARDLYVSQDDKTIVDSVMLIEYEDAYLEVIEDSARAEKFGLEKEITEDIIGKHIVYLQKEVPEAERSNYIVTDGKTDIELLEYSPAPYKAVRIFRDGDKYYYALFCNYLIETNESLPIQDAFEVYGIDEASDIVSITPVKSDNTWKPNKKVITDSAVISEFFNEISKLPAFCFDDYHDLVFADELKKLEEPGGDIGSEAYTRVADDRKDIVIETKEGLRFGINYYPSYGWINVSTTMSYYQISPKLWEWFSNYVK